MKHQRLLHPVSAAFLVLTGCLSQSDIGSNQNLNPGCEAGTRFGQDNVKCGESAAELDLSLGAPSQQALLRGQGTTHWVTRFGSNQLIPIQIQNLGQTPATLFRATLVGDPVPSDIFMIVPSSELPSGSLPPCGEQIAPLEKCNLTLRFQPRGQNYQAQRWRSTLVVEYEDGRAQQQLQFPMELEGELCSRQSPGLEFDREPLREVGRLESDRLAVTQAFQTTDLLALPAEISHIWVPLKLSRNQTRFDRLVLSIHLNEDDRGGNPRFEPIFESELRFAEFQERVASSMPPLNPVQAPFTDFETELSGFTWIRFELPAPLKFDEPTTVHWALRTEGLKDGALLFGKVDEIEQGGMGYPSGHAGTWTLPLTGPARYAAQTYRDIEFRVDQCLPLSQRAQQKE